MFGFWDCEDSQRTHLRGLRSCLDRRKLGQGEVRLSKEIGNCRDMIELVENDGMRSCLCCQNFAMLSTNLG
jgi:hypothetical protein